jgi:ubiquinone/menaquinone biosynthesis C-methylase UbiE
LNLSFPDERFDLVLFDQVLEHVEGNSQDAIDEIYRVLTGGLRICGTVHVYPIHAYPSDFWPFTPEGLKLLCSDYLETVECGGWGNIYLRFLAWLGLIRNRFRSAAGIRFIR